MALLRKMTYNDKASYGSSLPCRTGNAPYVPGVHPSKARQDCDREALLAMHSSESFKSSTALGVDHRLAHSNEERPRQGTYGPNNQYNMRMQQTWQAMDRGVSSGERTQSVSGCRRVSICAQRYRVSFDRARTRK